MRLRTPIPAIRARPFIWMATALAAGWSASCGDKEPPTEPEAPNQAPTAVGAIPAVTLAAGESATVNAQSYFTDPDGDALEYTATTSSAAVAAVSVSGSTITVGAVAEGSAAITITARDPGGLAASQNVAVTVQRPNSVPQAMGTIPAQTLRAGESAVVNLSSYFTDPDGDALTYDAASSNTSVVTAAVSGGTLTFSGVAEGSATVTVTARDPGGLAASQNVAVTVQRSNRAPQAVGTVPAQTLRAGESAIVNLSSYFTDPDGDALTYDAASSNTSVVTADASGSAVTFSGVAEGSATVTVAARDPGGLSAMHSVSVTVRGRNRAPEAVGTIPEQKVTAGESTMVNLSRYFSDPDGDALTYDAASNDTSVVTTSVSGGALTLSGVAEGRARVTATATDGTLSAQQLVLVSVEAAAAGICGRTEQVVAAILYELRGVSDCALVTDDHLAAIDGRLDLTNDGITSLKPDDFAGLSSLEALTVSDNSLVVLPDALFAGLPSLETLRLSNNRLTSLPRAAFFELAELRELNLTNNLLTSLEEGMFAGLSRLESLHLNGNRLTGLPDRVFSGMPLLRALQLSRNQLRSLTREAFAGLPLLRQLWLYENELGVGTLPDGVFSQLTSLWVLDLNDNRMPDLSSAAFSGLTSLGSLELADNLLTSLPDGLFAGMSRLFSVHLHDNPTDPLPITISLEPAGEGQFKARAHAGAPFDITLPIGVTNGVMDGGSTVTIPIGSVESRVVTVTRAAGTTGPVTVDLGELPGLPRERSSSGRLYHQGYELSRSADLPLQVLSAAAGWRYR